MAKFNYGKSGRGYGIIQTQVPKKPAKKKKKKPSFQPRTKHFYVLSFTHPEGRRITEFNSTTSSFEIRVPLQHKINRIHQKSAGLIRLNKAYKIDDSSIEIFDNNVLISGKGYTITRVQFNKILDKYKLEYEIKYPDYTFSVYRRINDVPASKISIHKDTKPMTKKESTQRQRNNINSAVTQKDSHSFVVDTETFNRIRRDNPYPLVINNKGKDKKKKKHNS